MLLMEKIQDKSYAIQPAFGFSNVNNTGLGANLQQIIQELFSVPAGLNLPAFHPPPVFGLDTEAVTFGTLSIETVSLPPSVLSAEEDTLEPLSPPPPPNVSVSAVASATQTSQPSSSISSQSTAMPLHTAPLTAPVTVQAVHFLFNPVTSSWEPVQNPLGNQNAPGLLPW